ncbi:MAG TPA: hypothetical protein VMV10_01415 [Pirellulales bacterium]|nr:hypothetical protein [Pirellulales bacterium]
MAREEHDREDLLAEATALVERAELRVAGFSDLLVVGFRRGGAASLYFGAEPAYHFNAAGQLRRACATGLLYKAERGKLISLERRRAASQVQLVRHELTDEETASFLTALTADLLALDEALKHGRYERLRQEPAGADVVARIQAWCAAHGRNVLVASSPRVG